MGVTLENAWHNISPEKNCGNSNINDEKEFPGFHISCEKAAINELTEHAKSGNASNVKNRDTHRWLAAVTKMHQ